MPRTGEKHGISRFLTGFGRRGLIDGDARLQTQQRHQHLVCRAQCAGWSSAKKESDDTPAWWSGALPYPIFMK